MCDLKLRGSAALREKRGGKFYELYQQNQGNLNYVGINEHKICILSESLTWVS